jgi:hypothetical protein
MKPTATSPSHTSRRDAEILTIRMAVPDDAAALSHLAQLDSARPPGPEQVLVAEVAGELRAALPLGGGPVIADPFHRTADLVAMLAERARQLVPQSPRRSARRWRTVRAARPVLVPRA